MIDCADSSGCAASAGAWTVKYNRFRHCTPAMNFDFVISISDLLGAILVSFDSAVKAPVKEKIAPHEREHEEEDKDKHYGSRN